MKTLAVTLALMLGGNATLAGQRLREVPQRFAYVQPVGLVAGIGTAGLEFAAGRRTTIELGVLGVYTTEDGVELYGGGLGLGFRRYFAAGEPAGFFGGLRVDGVRLVGRDNVVREEGVYLGLGALFGYRWLTRSGLLFEPVAGYEFLIGPRPLIQGSGRLQNELGLLVGLGIGWAW
jgi:hypothetical protein